MIPELVERYQYLINTYEHYYECEVFTKFEDAFISEYHDIGLLTSGLKIVHGHRSMVTYRGTVKCELGDIEILMNDPSKLGYYRRVFVQFKSKASKDTFDISTNQDDLYNDEESYVSKLGITGEINRANAMYAVVDGNELVFGNCDAFPMRKGCKRREFVAGGATQIAHRKYDFLEYAGSFNAFLEQMKEMKVGEELVYSGSVAEYTKSSLTHTLMVIDVSVL